MPANAKTERAPARRTAARARPPADETLDLLTVALRHVFQMTEEDALAVAGVVAERFAGQREVNDETIDAEVRSLFYTLEGRRLLAFRREEYDSAEGQKRRAFWWRIRPEVVAELGAAPSAEGDADVYASLPAECWRRAAA